MNAALSIVMTLLVGAAARSQLSGVSVAGEHPAIRYQGTPLHDSVSVLNQKLGDGSAHLDFDASSGYLKSVLSALQVPDESQILVFSKTSLQSFMVGPDNPRAIFFNDSVAVAYIRGSPTLEVIAEDPQQGAAFYTIAQDRQNRPLLSRETVCLSCHETAETFGVSGMVVHSVFPGVTGAMVPGLTGSPTDHRTPFMERWGGWYVSGKQGPLRHIGNAIINAVREGDDSPTPPAPVGIREPLPARFSLQGYPTEYSDVVALSVFEHQMHMMNLITRIGWEARIATSESRSNVEELLQSTAKALVDYLLFVDEAPFTATMEGSSGFAEQFAMQGPFDGKGRSLRQLDLTNRLMRYPCSYMIYSEAFSALTPPAKNAVYRRMWEILSGQDKDAEYQRLSIADRKSIVEILRDTLNDLTDYFQL
jgi:hypothetical protein